jgi:hypothetical protein
MDQLGHTDPGFTLRVYRHGMRRDHTTKEILRALVDEVARARRGQQRSLGHATLDHF